jgi:peptidoglycan/xylan/chitin deacetylase (PgdA/CDA1 family)
MASLLIHDRYKKFNLATLYECFRFAPFMKNLFRALYLASLSIGTVLLFNSCDFKGTSVQAGSLVLPADQPFVGRVDEEKPAAENPIPVAAAELIMARPQVPILCYHQVRDYKSTDSRSSRDYIVPPSIFSAQMKALADSGYHTILPKDLYVYLATGAGLPEKPVLISFDDGCDEQFDITHQVLDPLRFKASFFIMTVSVNRPNYLKADQIKQLSEEGHAIGLHTWDHHNVKQYQPQDWVTQVDKPKAQLEKIIGAPIQFFAYPFGLWNEAAIPALKNRGLQAAFQLSTARDPKDPLYTIRRIIVTGDASGTKLIAQMHRSFH